jgi:hypothetical protein
MRTSCSVSKIALTLIICGFLMISLSSTILAQEVLEYPTLGIKVTVPYGFGYEENEDGLILYSNQYPDTYFILAQHEYNHIDELKTIADEPYEEKSIGLKLTKSGDIELVDANAIGAYFTGKVGNNKALAFILARLNPFGEGVSIIGLTINQNLDKEILRTNVIELNKGVVLEEITMSTEIIEWIEKLNNTRLEYRTSYSSNSYTSGSVSGYSSSSEAMELCSDGYFNYSGSSNTSMSSGGLGVLGNSNSSKKGNGEWSIEENDSKEPVLLLKYYNGSVEEYSMYYKKGYLYLNDYKYTIGRGQEYGPSCN